MFRKTLSVAETKATLSNAIREVEAGQTSALLSLQVPAEHIPMNDKGHRLRAALF